MHHPSSYASLWCPSLCCELVASLEYTTTTHVNSHFRCIHCSTTSFSQKLSRLEIQRYLRSRVRSTSHEGHMSPMALQLWVHQEARSRYREESLLRPYLDSFQAINISPLVCEDLPILNTLCASAKVLLDRCGGIFREANQKDSILRTQSIFGEDDCDSRGYVLAFDDDVKS